jgi:succinate dehydrogenase hydrophobic anchor subunit
MKTLHFLIIGISVIGGIGPALILSEIITNNSQETLTLRFSQSFFNIFTLIPLLIIALGSIIMVIAICERKIRTKQVTTLMILIGSVILFLGFGVFGFYLID